MLGTTVFLLFSFGILFSAFKVILANNPVEGVLYLLLVLFNGSGLLLMEGAEYFAFLLIMIYAGAIMVLFLFVVMMLNPRFVELQASSVHYYSMLVFILLELFLLLYLMFRFSLFEFPSRGELWLSNPDLYSYFNNKGMLFTMSLLLFSLHSDLFILIAVVLLVSMLGAILLASHSALSIFKTVPTREKLYMQVAASYKNNVNNLS